MIVMSRAMFNLLKNKLAVFTLLTDHFPSTALEVRRAVILAVKILGRIFWYRLT
jgi:hypothetical protein